MQTILTITVPFFALIFFGYAAAIRRWVPVESVPAFNGFLLYFAVPAMLFRFASTSPFREIANAPFFLAWIAAGLAVLLATTWMARARGLGVRDAAFFGLCGAVGNAGFLGVPLLVALLGERAAPSIILAIAADLAVMATVGLAIAHSGKAADGGRGMSAGEVAKRLALNPLLLSMIAGATFSAFGWKLLTPLDEIVRLLANAAGPCALFAIGVSLVQPGARLNSGIIALPIGAKLIMHPLAVWAAMHVAGVGDFVTTVAVLTAALPCAGWVFIFAQRDGADAGRIAATILASTALAFITVSSLVWLLGVRPPG
jgi:malonate transporter